MIIFGWGYRRTKSIGPVKESHCGRCNNSVSLELVKLSTWFTLFFIPVFPYENRKLLVCPICGAYEEISKEEFDELETLKRQGLLEIKVNNSGRLKTETQLNYIKEMQEFEEEKNRLKNEQVAEMQIPAQTTQVNALDKKAIPQVDDPRTENTSETTFTESILRPRFWGAFVDYLVVIIPLCLMFFSSSENVIFIGFLLLLIILVMQATLLAISGQSLGKKFFKLKIVRSSDGQKAGFIKTYVIRTLINGLLYFSIIYPVIDITMITRPDRRCLHDIIAGTKVIKS